MELEHQHKRRLPNSDAEPNSYGVANGYAGYPNSNSHTDSDPNGHSISDSNTGDTYSHPNGHGISDRDTSDTNSDSNTNRNANTRSNLHGDVCEPGVDHHCGHAPGDSLSE
jgi:hypothetical protein